MVDVTDPAAVDSLLQNAPDRANSSILFVALYTFSILCTLFKTLSSFDNILFINTALNHARRKRRASAG